jgi:hypothetical protein
MIKAKNRGAHDEDFSNDVNGQLVRPLPSRRRNLQMRDHLKSFD